MTENSVKDKIQTFIELRRSLHGLIDGNSSMEDIRHMDAQVESAFYELMKFDCDSQIDQMELIKFAILELKDLTPSGGIEYSLLQLIERISGKGL